MSEISSVITAICMVLTVIGGFLMWLHAFSQSRMPDFNFVATRIMGSKLYRVTIYPKRIKYAYRIDNIKSSCPLYSGYKGIDVLGNGNPELFGKLNKDELELFVPSSYQKIETEPFITVHLNLTEYKKSVYTMRVLFKSERFPFYWGKPIDIAK